MSALTPDYDDDPGRSRSFQRGWQEDVHGPVAERLVAESLGSVLDVGCGIGRFAAVLEGRVAWIGADSSPRQLSDSSYRPVVRALAEDLPFRDSCVDAVVMLWMLYHLRDPRLAVAEGRRVLRKGGLLAACAASRDNDPELVPGGYPPTTFDAENAAELVSEAFGAQRVEVERWDMPLVRLEDRSELTAYARSHLLPASCVDAVETPLTLTKRGCLVWARR